LTQPIRLHMDKILLLTKRFSISGDSNWLTDDLAWALVSEGYDVVVIFLDLNNEHGKYAQHQLHKHLVVHSYGINHRSYNNPVLRNTVLFLTLWRTLRAVRRKLKSERFSLVINFSIFIFYLNLVRFLKKNKIAEISLGVIWDFFPIHHMEIGRLNNFFLGKLLTHLERREVRSLDGVGLMSQKNLEFFQHYHPSYSGHTFILRIWGSPEQNVDLVHDRPRLSKNFNIVFGGQLTKGRGIDTILDLAYQFENELQDVRIIFIGSGPLKEDIMNSNQKLILFVDRMNRPDYINFIATCDLGLIITEGGVSIPSFPSKIIDYTFAGLPVLAIVEQTTDFGQFVSEEAQCGSFINIDQPADKLLINIKNEILELKDNHQRYTKLKSNSRKTFDQYFKSSSAVKSIMHAVDKISLV
jgi:glycosyltransferase involved in cell wall biosynthesis